MSRLWHTDARTHGGKWKIEQCSVRPETAIIVVTMDTIIITIIVVTIIITIIIADISITYIITVLSGSSVQQRLARNATTLNLRLAELSQERWVRYTLITRHTGQIVRSLYSSIFQCLAFSSFLWLLTLVGSKKWVPRSPNQDLHCCRQWGKTVTILSANLHIFVSF